MNDKFICPVCGFNGLEEAPYRENNKPSFEICHCCGYEFGFNDTSNIDIKKSHQIYREKWIKDGAKWFLPQFIPHGWQLSKQLENIIKN
ncbi:MAG: hypothetical protein ABIA97_01960 [Candidatus Omnitrophota bacterium]